MKDRRALSRPAAGSFTPAITTSAAPAPGHDTPEPSQAESSHPEEGAHGKSGSTKRTNRQDALKVEATQRTRLLNSIQGIPNPTAVPTFAEFADQFLKWAKTNLAEATVVLHRVNIDRLKQFFRGKLINEIGRKSVEEFKVWRAGQKRKNADSKVSGATVNRCLAALKRIFNHADAMGLNVRKSA